MVNNSGTFLQRLWAHRVKFLGMHPCERSDKVPDNKNTHTLLLAGGVSWEGPGCPWEPGIVGPQRRRNITRYEKAS